MSSTVRVLVTGVKGRMGAALVRRVRDDGGMQLLGGMDRPGSSSIGLDVGLVVGLGALEVPVMDNLQHAIEQEKPDVLIDFTSAEASVEYARICARNKVALVVGSTGFSPEDTKAIEAAAQEIPVVMAPNMSVGVNLVIQLAGQLARVLGDDFDIEVLETHHRMKKDAPSGTALRLAEELAHALGRSSEDFCTSRIGRTRERPQGEIGLQSLRGGDVVGEHTVFFFGDGERVELTHRATSRDQFARGAVRAARWVVKQQSGLYDMHDVLGLR